MTHSYLIGSGRAGLDCLVLAEGFAETMRGLLGPQQEDFKPFMEPYLELEVTGSKEEGIVPQLTLLWGEVPPRYRITAISDRSSEEEDECAHLWLVASDAAYHLLRSIDRSWLAGGKVGAPTLAPWARRDRPLTVEVVA